jgi:hypothetical protein
MHIQYFQMHIQYFGFNSHIIEFAFFQQQIQIINMHINDLNLLTVENENIIINVNYIVGSWKWYTNVDFIIVSDYYA